MKPSEIADAVERIASIEVTIPAIRRLVVALALRGELDRATPTETPEGILARFAAARESAIKNGRIRRQSDPIATLIPKSIKLPANCPVDRLSNLAIIEKGPTGIQSAKPGPYPLVVTAEARGVCDHFDFEGPAAIVPLVSSTGHGHASIHRLHYQEGRFALGSILCAIFPLLPELLSARFLFEYLTAFKQELLVDAMVGTANVSLTVAKVGAVPVPLVSTEAQRRVDELMSLIDDLEAKQAKKRVTQARLRAATLDALTTAEPDAWNRVEGNFGLLVANPDDVAALRGVIHEMALRGALSGMVRAEGQAISEVRRIKADVQPFPPDAEPWPLPSGWAWLHLKDVVGTITDGDHLPPPQVPNGVPFLTIGNVTSGRVMFSDSRFVPREYFDGLDPRRVPRKGDVLYTVVGATYGRPVRVEDTREFCVQRHIAILKPDASCDPDYLYTFLKSPLAYRQASASLTGTAQPTVALGPLRKFAVPVPPIAEQRRIVRILEGLMNLCDELEAKLRHAEDTAAKLAEAVVASLVA